MNDDRRSLPVARPIATAMLFAALILLGVIALRKIPVELFPPLSGSTLYVNFARPGSEPEVVERELLQPLNARVRELADVTETWGRVTGSSGNLQVVFGRRANMKVRELELRRLASDLQRTQPRGARVDVSSFDLQAISRFVMVVNVSGGDDLNALHDLVEQRIRGRLSAVPGVAQVIVAGGAGLEARVVLDPDRLAALGVTPGEVVRTIAEDVTRQRFVGLAHDDRGQVAVIVDGRPRGVVSLGQLRVSERAPVQLGHVATIDLGGAREESLYLIDGKAAVAVMIFQEEGQNLVRLGQDLRARLAELRREFVPLGIKFEISTDAAQLVDDQLARLRSLALSGFLIALVVLFLFLRQLRAVLVVAISVPVSLLIALAALYTGGLTLNLITMFGLAVAIGMLVDNSIVVYESVQRQLERGVRIDEAVRGGLRRTQRAILASTATNAIVFLPLMFVDLGDATLQSLVGILAAAVVLPQIASVLVALGLVPLLTRWLAAPAAVAALARLRAARTRLAGMRPPERGRELFTGLVTVALRRPAGWLAGVAAVVLLITVFVIPLLIVSSASSAPTEVDSLRMSVELPKGGSLESARAEFALAQEVLRDLKGIKQVTSFIREEGGTLTIDLVDAAERPEEFTAATVREALLASPVLRQRGIVLADEDESGGGGGGRGGGQQRGGAAALFGQAPAEVVLSGPDSGRLRMLAEDIAARLRSVPDIAMANVSTDQGDEELQVMPRREALDAYGLTADQVLPELSTVRREGVVMRVGFALPDGREVPLVVRRKEQEHRLAKTTLEDLRLSTTAGVLPLNALADVRRMPPPPVIEHHDGRRETRVSYSFKSSAPQSGPARVALEAQIRGEIRRVERPAGYTIEPPNAEDTTSLLKRLLVPVLLLLLAILAITFESLVLPLVVLLALPLTIIGASTALLINDLPLGQMALVGVIALLGITVNPAILLVDRMQERVRSGRFGPGAAALTAVRERTRPVLMTTATTLAGLWPLALVTGKANEIWPPFATVVIGGLLASTLLTLLVIPIGFTIAQKLDRLFGRLGPWLVIGWAVTTGAIIVPLVSGGLVTSLTWEILTTLFVGGVLLGGVALVMRQPAPVPVTQDGAPPAVAVRFLHKIYGQPGPIGYAWRVTDLFARRVLARGGRPFDRLDARRLIPATVAVTAALAYLALNVRGRFWAVVLLALALGGWGLTLKALRRARGLADPLGKTLPGGLENWLALASWWVAWLVLAWRARSLPHAEMSRAFVLLILGALLLSFVQWGRRVVGRVGRGDEQGRLERGVALRPRNLLRSVALRLLGFDRPLQLVHALSGAEFRAEGGMIGILGPNGAGKTTLLRLLAGILEPSRGVIELGGVRLATIRRFLARWLGYLPQDFGLPADLTARQYLDYWALLYEVGDAARRRERVDQLLTDVGLADRADEKIGSFSGGMRQRVAVARTLLRLPSVIIVDEPTVGLDPRERIRFRNLLSRLAAGRIVLFSTHVVEDVAVACERVLVLARGKLVFDGPPTGLAQLAEGKVWELRLAPGEEATLPGDLMVSDLLPLPGGGSKARILAAVAPRADAEPALPTLEDGYLLLVGPTARGSVAA